MKKPYGISFEIGRADSGWFWYLGKLKLRKMRPSLDGMDAIHGGFKFDLMLGSWRRPFSKWYNIFGFIKYLFQKDYAKYQARYNPWNSGNHWFVFPNIALPGFFFSLSYGTGERQPGFYLGCKSYEVNRISQNKKIYKADRNDIITDEIAWGDASEKGNIYLCPTASIRDDLVD